MWTNLMIESVLPSETPQIRPPSSTYIWLSTSRLLQNSPLSFEHWWIFFFLLQSSKHFYSPPPNTIGRCATWIACSLLPISFLIAFLLRNTVVSKYSLLAYMSWSPWVQHWGKWRQELKQWLWEVFSFQLTPVCVNLTKTTLIITPPLRIWK